MEKNSDIKNIKKQVACANQLLSKCADERKSILAEGRNKEWTKNKLHDLEEKYLKAAQVIKNNIKVVAQDALIVAQKEARNLRSRPNNHLKPTDSAARLYHLNLGKMAFDGLSPDEALKLFPSLVRNLADYEIEYQSAYEDSLKAHLKKGEDRALAWQVIFNNLPAERKCAEVAAMRAQAILNKAEMIAENMSYDLEKIAKGEDAPKLDYGEILDDALKIEQPEQPELPIKFEAYMNPYDHETEETESNTEESESEVS